MNKNSNIQWGYALSCFLAANDNPERDIVEIFDLIQNAGCDGYQIDVPLTWPLEQILQQSERSGLKCLAINDWQQNLEEVDSHLQVAVELNAQLYNHHFPSDAVNDMGAAVDWIHRFDARCAAEGIQYCIELHRNTFTESIDRTYELMARCPEIKFLGDFSHYVILNEPESRYEPMFNRLAALHLRVANPEAIQPEIIPGKTFGLDTFEKMFKKILKDGFKGPVISEMIPFYVQYPRYNLHDSNIRLLGLAQEWAESVCTEAETS